MPSEPTLLTYIYALGILSALVMGVLMRLVANPIEASSIKQRMRELESTLPPKHLRTPKHERKARIIESEVRKLRKRYTIITLKRLTAMFFVYGVTLTIIFLRLPPMISSPVPVPLFTYEIEGKIYVPTSIVYIMIILLLSPTSLRLAEPPIIQKPRNAEEQKPNRS
jgi:hypothetical protein